MSQPVPTLVDCECGLRYMKYAIRTINVELGHFRCSCGHVLGAWNGTYRLVFELGEDAAPDGQSPQ